MGETKYKISLVTFLDILGFKKIVDTHEIDDIIAILSSFKRVNKPISNYHGKPMFVDVITFSDMALRVGEIHADIGKMLSDLYMEIISLESIQCELVSKGVLIRGGITIGNMHFNNDKSRQLAFGPAFVIAHEIESNLALYPRIVVDPEIFRYIKDQLPSAGVVRSMFKPSDIMHLLKQDYDGLSHIDYLRRNLGESPGTKGDQEFLKDHKALIERGRNENKERMKVLTKYYWLESYHNSFVDSLGDKVLSEIGATRKELLVIPEDYGLP